MALLIDKKQRQLLLESEVTKEFPFLVTLLNDYESISKDVVDTLPKSQQIFFKDTLPFAMEQAQAEWHAEKGCHDHGETTIPCTLCGTPNRYIYYITNGISGKSINVGSDCVNEYFDDIAKKKGKSGFAMDKINAQKIRRLDEFYQSFPGAGKTLDSWINNLSFLPIMIPAVMESEIRELSFQGKMLIKEYQDRKRPDQEILGEFAALTDNYNKVNNRVIDFVKIESENPWIVTKPIYEWLRQNNKKAALEKLKTGCVIDISTFSEIWEPQYMRTITPTIDKLLSELDFKISSLDYAANSFSLRYNGDLKLIVQIRFLLLLSMLGPYVVGNSKPPLDIIVHDNILKYCSIKDDSSMFAILYKLNLALRSYGYIMPYYQPDYDEVFIINELKLQYSEQKLTTFLKTSMGHILYKKIEMDANEVIGNLTKAKNWYSVDKLSDLLNDRYGGNNKWYPLKDNTIVKRLEEKR